jgi:hypothetical protein
VEPEAGGASLSYVVRPCLKIKQKTKLKINGLGHLHMFKTTKTLYPIKNNNNK